VPEKVPACYALLVQMRHALLSVFFVALACEAGEGPRGAQQKPASVVAVKPRVTNDVPTEPPPDPTAARPAAPNGVEWRGAIEWHEWRDALGIASRAAKPIMVVVYADWCPHCRALGPVFADPEIESLSKRFVMVRQNHDDSPSWLEPYNQKFGGYVPRIFFFDQNGKMREDLTSGHPRYPYFYAAEQPEFLKRSMRRAIGS